MVAYILEEEMEFLSSASQLRSCLPQQPSNGDRETLVPLPHSLTRPSGPDPWHSLLPVASGLALPFPSHFKLLQWREFLNYSMSLHTSENLTHIFLDYFSPMVYLFIFQNLAQLSLPPNDLFWLSLHPWPMLWGTSVLLRFLHCTICFFSYLPPLLGCDSLGSRLCFILLLYTQHIGKELAPSKHSTYNCWKNIVSSTCPEIDFLPQIVIQLLFCNLFFFNHQAFKTEVLIQ